jgi:hypothetical protein
VREIAWRYLATQDAHLLNFQNTLFIDANTKKVMLEK